jgi:plasmid stability protein
MGQILVRNVPDETIQAYKDRAKIKGTSLEQEIRNLLEANRPYTPEERYAVALRLQAMTPPGPRTSVVDLIREDRDR